MIRMTVLACVIVACLLTVPDDGRAESAPGKQGQTAGEPTPADAAAFIGDWTSR